MESRQVNRFPALFYCGQILLFQVFWVIRHMHPARVWYAPSIKLKNQLRIGQIFSNPLGQFVVWNARDLNVGGLAPAMVRRARAAYLGIDVGASVPRVYLHAFAKMLAHRL